MIYALAFGTYTVLASTAPVYGNAVLASLTLILIYHLWEGGIMANAVLVAICKRKGICYGIMAFPRIAFLHVGFLVLSLSLALLFVPTTHTGGKAEPPAQPPTPFA